jgi:hypothetical protein
MMFLLALCLCFDGLWPREKFIGDMTQWCCEDEEPVAEFITDDADFDNRIG